VIIVEKAGDAPMRCTERQPIMAAGKTTGNQQSKERWFFIVRRITNSDKIKGKINTGI